MEKQIRVLERLAEPFVPAGRQEVRRAADQREGGHNGREAEHRHERGVGLVTAEVSQPTDTGNPAWRPWLPARLNPAPLTIHKRVSAVGHPDIGTSVEVGGIYLERGVWGR